MIKINNLNYRYKNINVFNNFDLHINENEFTCIVGPNGSGKTTLMKLILNRLNHNNSILISRNYKFRSNYKGFPLEVGIYINDYNNFFLMGDVYDELAFPLANLNYSEDEINKRILALAEQLNTKELLGKRVETLTSTEKQKIGFMISIIHEPKLIILDNPFNNFTNQERESFLNKLVSLNKTVLLFSHNLEDSLLSDYLYILYEGKIAIEGKPLSVMNEHKLLVKMGLEIPFMVDLSQKLNFYEIHEGIELNMETMVNKLWK